jgi:peptide/nickel transport system permease protein
MIVILWTDALVFLLVAVIAGYFLYVRRQPHLLVSWRRVTRSAYGMAALVVLAVFIVIGVLDSIHYRPSLEHKDGQGTAAYAAEVLSLYDALATPLRARVERTYSAPFATRAYQRETLEVTARDGRLEQVREYPRLSYGGAHLRDESDLGNDVLVRALRGLVMAFVLWWVLAAAVAAWQAHPSGRSVRDAWRAIWRGETAVPWHAVLFTIGVLLALALPVLASAPGW